MCRSAIKFKDNIKFGSLSPNDVNIIAGHTFKARPGDKRGKIPKPMEFNCDEGIKGDISV